MKSKSDMKKIILLILPALLWVSCTKESTTEAGEAHEIRFALTRTGENPPADGTTFRIMAYSQNGASFVASGTYVYKSDSEYGILVPCRVNNDGTLANGGTYEPTYGLKLINNIYTMALISPAALYTDGTFLTFPVNREVPFFASTPEQITIAGYNIYSFTEPVADKRIVIDEVTFLKGENLPVSTEFAITDVELLNAGQSATYHANSMKVDINPADAAPQISIREATPAEQTTNPALRYVTTNPTYAFHTTYGKNDVLPLMLKFDLTYSATKTVRVPISSLVDFQPSKKYRFNFTVSTVYVVITVDIYDNNQWEPGNNDGQEEIGNPTETIDLGTWEIGQWETGNEDGPEIFD